MCKSLRSFWRRDEGVSTIETLLWFPFVLMMILAMADFYFVQTRQALVLRMLDMGTRSFATGQIKSCSEFRYRMMVDLAETMPSMTSSCNIRGSILTASLTVGAYDLGMGIVSKFLGDFTIVSSGMQTFEYVPDMTIEEEENTNTNTNTGETA